MKTLLKLGPWRIVKGKNTLTTIVALRAMLERPVRAENPEFVKAGVEPSEDQIRTWARAGAKAGRHRFPMVLEFSDEALRWPGPFFNDAASVEMLGALSDLADSITRYRTILLESVPEQDEAA